ncbi:transposase-like protein [Embleya sp. AB8]
MCIVACDGLKGLPDAVTATWPKATIRTCVIHLIRASLRFTSRKDHTELVTALKAIHTAPTEQAAAEALDEFAVPDPGVRYPAIVRTGRRAWPGHAPSPGPGGRSSVSRRTDRLACAARRATAFSRSCRPAWMG